MSRRFYVPWACTAVVRAESAADADRLLMMGALPSMGALLLFLLAVLVGVVLLAVVLSLRHRRLLQSAERRLARSQAQVLLHRRERALLLDLVQLQSETGSPRALLRKVVERIGRGLHLDGVGIYLVEADQLVLRAWYGAHAAGAPPAAHEVSLSQGLLGELTRERAVLFLDRAGADPRTRGLPPHLQKRGFLGLVPITRNGRAFGMVVSASDTPGPLASAPEPFLRALSSQLGLTVCQDQLIHQLRELSTHDDLTGLANRRLLNSRMQAEAFRCDRFDHTTSLLAIDIDHFKQLNDRHGHATGDAALAEVARLMLAAVRKVDLVARLGGEEFVVVLPRTERAQALIVAEKLRTMIASAQIPGGAMQPGGSLTVSIGLASFGAQDDADAALAEADKAMYRAKQRGRNRVELAGSDPRRATAS